METSKGLEALRVVDARETQEEVARAVGVTQQSVSSWVRGSKTPRGLHMVALQRVYGIAIESWASVEAEAA